MRSREIRRKKHGKKKEFRFSKSPLLLLDQFRLGDLKHWQKIGADLNQYEALFYTSLAVQRSRNYPQLLAALANAAAPFSENNWQRCVNAQWELQPLSARGSVLNAIGGRFNIGAIDASRYTSFPALYLAQDKRTAYCEKFGIPEDTQSHGLQARDLVLSHPAPIAFVCAKFSLDLVLDLGNSSKLKEFVDLIKGFDLPPEIKEHAAKIGLRTPDIVRTTDSLVDSLLDRDWKARPAQVDVPCNSQLFGQIARDAQIQGILYPSKWTGDRNLAIFPENMIDATSFIELEGDYPAELKNRRMDHSTWRKFI